MEDIAPELLQQLQRRFSEKVSINPKIRALYKKIQSGSATYVDAENYAYLVGDALSQTFGEILSSSVLPDGRMYYNIADRVVRPLLMGDYSLVSDAAAMVQKALNEKAKIGIKPQTVAANEDRISGIVDKISNAERFDDVAWVLDEPVKNFSMNVVDETLKVNASFQYRSGRNPRIIRQAESRCCKWCSALEGEYQYPDVPDDIYRRHERCRCVVDYDPGDGRRQNVHSKHWTDTGRDDRIKTQEVATSTNATGSKYRRAGTQRVQNSQLPNGLPIGGTAGTIVDKIDDFGKVLQRRVYGPDGKAMIDYDTTDHGMPTAHPNGAHKHAFDYSKKNPHGPPLPLSEEELIENVDIIRRGDNYHD